jgi:hypothetical protein
MCAAVSWKLRQIRQSSWEQTRQFSPCSSQTWVPQSAHSPNSSLPHGYPNASTTCATSMISQYPGTCPLCLQCRVQLQGISTRVPEVCSKRFVQSNSGNIRRATLAHVRVGVLVAVVTPVVRPGSRQLTNCRRTEATTPHRQLKGEAVEGGCRCAIVASAPLSFPPANAYAPTMPQKEAAPVEQNDETMAEHRIAQSKKRVEESRVMMENSRVTRLASINTFRNKSKRRAAAARAKIANANMKNHEED